MHKIVHIIKELNNIAENLDCKGEYRLADKVTKTMTRLSWWFEDAQSEFNPASAAMVPYQGVMPGGLFYDESGKYNNLPVMTGDPVKDQDAIQQQFQMWAPYQQQAAQDVNNANYYLMNSRIAPQLEQVTDQQLQQSPGGRGYQQRQPYMPYIIK